MVMVHMLPEIIHVVEVIIAMAVVVGIHLEEMAHSGEEMVNEKGSLFIDQTIMMIAIVGDRIEMILLLLIGTTTVIVSGIW